MVVEVHHEALVVAVEDMAEEDGVRHIHREEDIVAVIGVVAAATHRIERGNKI